MKVVSKPDPEQLTFKRGKNATLEIAGLLERSHQIFIAGMNRKSASYYKKRLQSITRKPVSSAAAAYAGEEGYVFNLNGVTRHVATHARR